MARHDDNDDDIVTSLFTAYDAWFLKNIFLVGVYIWISQQFLIIWTNDGKVGWLLVFCDLSIFVGLWNVTPSPHHIISVF